MAREYVEKRNSGFYLLDSRISIDSIVYQFLDGASPESIVDEFPTLTLEQVYGAIAFYLANRSEIDQYLAGVERLQEEARKNQSQIPPGLKGRLERARRDFASKRT